MTTDNIRQAMHLATGAAEMTKDALVLLESLAGAGMLLLDLDGNRSEGWTKELVMRFMKVALNLREHLEAVESNGKQGAELLTAELAATPRPHEDGDGAPPDATAGDISGDIVDSLDLAREARRRLRVLVGVGVLMVDDATAGPRPGYARRFNNLAVKLEGTLEALEGELRELASQAPDAGEPRSERVVRAASDDAAE